MNVIKHLDLASVFKKEKPVVQPEIIGVITIKSEGLESIKGQIEEAGFSVAKSAEMEDGSVVFGQTESMEGEHVLIRLSEHAVMAVKAFNPYNVSMSMGDGTSFAEVCKAQGFYPGVGTMVDVLRYGVLQLAEKSEDSSAAAVQVGKMFDEAKQYTMTMIQGLPAKAFKLESIFPEEPAKVETTKSAGEKCADCGADMDADDTVCKACGKGKKAAMKDEAGEGKAADATNTEDATAKKSDGTQAADDQAAAAVAAAVPALTEEAVAVLVGKQMTEFATKMETMLGGMTKAVETVGSNVQALSVRVDAAEVAAQAATLAVKGTVVLGSDGGDQVEVAQKSESRAGREIDTAYTPRSQRNTMGRR